MIGALHIKTPAPKNATGVGPGKARAASANPGRADLRIPATLNLEKKIL